MYNCDSHISTGFRGSTKSTAKLHNRCVQTDYPLHDISMVLQFVCSCTKGQSKYKY